MRNLINRSWIVMLAVLSVVFIACKPTERIITNERIKTIELKEVLRDTVIKTEIDSSYYSAYIECVNNKPVLKTKTTAPGKNIKAPDVILNDSILSVKCETIAQELFFQWKEKYIKETDQQNKTEPVYIEKTFRWYEKVLMWIGAFALVSLLIYTGIKLTKIIRL